MKAYKVIKDPEAFQLLADGARRKIVYLLRVKEMNVSMLATELNLTPQAVYHHVKKLLKGELIEKTREERSGHLIESYYRATAEIFYFSHGTTPAHSARSKKLAEEQITTALKGLKKLGFNLEYDEKKISQLVDMQTQYEECCKDIDKIQNKIENMNELDIFTKKAVEELAEDLLMTEEEFNRQQETRSKFRKLLMSLVKK
jgi:DNA-binding transcriptional ArsR family regulator